MMCEIHRTLVTTKPDFAVGYCEDQSPQVMYFTSRQAMIKTYTYPRVFLFFTKAEWGAFVSGQSSTIER